MTRLVLTIAIAQPLAVAATVGLLAQGAKTRLTFETVAIRPSTGDYQRPVADTISPSGRVSLHRITAEMLIGRAYGAAVSAVLGVPDWAKNELFDIDASSPLARATPDDVTTMLRAMLSDRFKLLTHTEQRQQPVFELVRARSDGQLGPGLTRSQRDCEDDFTIDGQPEAPGRIDSLTGAPPLLPCTFRGLFLGGTPFGSKKDVFEGDTTMANFVLSLRAVTGRIVLDRTGLSGYYAVKMTFDRFATTRAPGIEDARTGSEPGVFTAVQEQLGLQLRAARAPLSVLVVDRLERPTAN